VDIDVGVESVLLSEEAHHGLRWVGESGPSLSPQRGRQFTLAENPTLGPASAAILLTPWDEPPAHPIEAIGVANLIIGSNWPRMID
jgi:hypothetical protein